MKKKPNDDEMLCGCEQAEKRVRDTVTADYEFVRQLSGPIGAKADHAALLAHVAATRRDLAGIRALERTVSDLQTAMMFALRRGKRRTR